MRSTFVVATAVALLSAGASNPVSAREQSAWVKLCDAGTGNCRTQHERLDGATGEAMVSVEIVESAGSRQKQLIVTLPDSTSQALALRGAILGGRAWQKASRGETSDGSPLKSFELVFGGCTNAGCTSQGEAGPEIIAAMRRGGGILFETARSNGDPIRLTVPLTGFGKAHAGKPVDSEKYAEARRQLLAAIKARKGAGDAGVVPPALAAEPGSTIYRCEGQTFFSAGCRQEFVLEGGKLITRMHCPPGVVPEFGCTVEANADQPLPSPAAGTEDCDFKVEDGDRLINACTQLIDGWPAPTGRGEDDMMMAKALLTRSTGWKLKGDTDRALADIERAIGLAPNVSGGYYFRAKIYVEMQAYDRALPDLDKAVALDHEESSDIFYVRGWTYEHKGDNDRAQADYRKALAIHDDHQGAKEGLARLAAGSRTPTGASAGARRDCEGYASADLKIQGCTQLIAENAENLPDIYTKRGHGYAMKKDFDRALADYDRAVEIDPKFAVAYSLRGLAYAEKGEHDRAIADYDKALQLRPDYIGTYVQRANSHFAKGDYDRAIAEYDKALAISPDESDALCGRGDAFAKKGDNERARTDYEMAQSDPETPCAADGSREQPGDEPPLCQPGAEASMSGTIHLMNPPGKLLSTGVNKYWSFAVNVTGGDCWTDLAVEFSNGAPPASCVEGSRVDVTGVVQDDEGGQLITDPKKLSCRPGSAAP